MVEKIKNRSGEKVIKLDDEKREEMTRKIFKEKIASLESGKEYKSSEPIKAIFFEHRKEKWRREQEAIELKRVEFSQGEFRQRAFLRSGERVVFQGKKDGVIGDFYIQPKDITPKIEFTLIEDK